jgi:hypothetical protein
MIFETDVFYIIPLFGLKQLKRYKPVALNMYLFDAYASPKFVTGVLILYNFENLVLSSQLVLGCRFYT